jgi:hypothetical protein
LPGALEKWVYDLTHGTTAFHIQLLAGFLRADSILRSKVQPAKKSEKSKLRIPGIGVFGLPTVAEFHLSTFLLFS